MWNITLGINKIQRGRVLKEAVRVNKMCIRDRVYSGTRTPKYTASLKNFFSYRDFDFSFMFVYYGGHVLRDVVAGYMGCLLYTSRCV